jgi:hypothetical protein
VRVPKTCKPQYLRASSCWLIRLGYKCATWWHRNCPVNANRYCGFHTGTPFVAPVLHQATPSAHFRAISDHFSLVTRIFWNPYAPCVVPIYFSLRWNIALSENKVLGRKPESTSNVSTAKSSRFGCSYGFSSWVICTSHADKCSCLWSTRWMHCRTRCTPFPQCLPDKFSRASWERSKNFLDFLFGITVTRTSALFEHNHRS